MEQCSWYYYLAITSDQSSSGLGCDHTHQLLQNKEEVGSLESADNFSNASIQTHIIIKVASEMSYMGGFYLPELAHTLCHCTSDWVSWFPVIWICAFGLYSLQSRNGAQVGGCLVASWGGVIVDYWTKYDLFRLAELLFSRRWAMKYARKRIWVLSDVRVNISLRVLTGFGAGASC